MPYVYRSYGERELLKVEAEMRVRAGEARSDVARALNIPGSTMAIWAAEGGWRRKDIEASTDLARLRELAARLSVMRERDAAHHSDAAAVCDEVNAGLKQLGATRAIALPRPKSRREVFEALMREREAAEQTRLAFDAEVKAKLSSRAAEEGWDEDA